METYKQVTLDEWMKWKEDIRRKLDETAENFVYIGYRLKQIRDSGMYGGAEDIFEFAKKEYGLGKSTVSRFIAINEKYSEGGNSLDLKEEYKGFSYSKLAEMLTLPDSESELVTEKTTIREIRELKAFDSQGKKEKGRTAGIEDQERTPLENCLVDFFKDKQEMLNGIIGRLREDQPAYKEAAGLMAPVQTSHRKGIVFLFLYEWDIGIKYKIMTDTNPVSMGWTEFLDLIYGIFGDSRKEDPWEAFYREKKREQEPEKEKDVKPVYSELDKGLGPVATSQQEETESRYQRTRQEAAGIGNDEDTEGRETETDQGTVKNHGQTREYGSGPESENEEDGACKGETDSCSREDMKEDKGIRIVEVDGLKQYVENQKNIMMGTMREMKVKCENGDWNGLSEKAREIIVMSEGVKNMEDALKYE